LPRVSSFLLADYGAFRDEVESINDRLSEGDANRDEQLFHSNSKNQKIVLSDLDYTTDIKEEKNDSNNGSSGSSKKQYELPGRNQIKKIASAASNDEDIF